MTHISFALSLSFAHEILHIEIYKECRACMHENLEMYKSNIMKNTDQLCGQYPNYQLQLQTTILQQFCLVCGKGNMYNILSLVSEQENSILCNSDILYKSNLESKSILLQMTI